ncbi:MAG: OadG family transporter subunit [Bacteroidales bacterium]|jgi:Na+-transporting methylmalonyl-CoA/oxaloacetate decarboxylase gamma subunit
MKSFYKIIFVGVLMSLSVPGFAQSKQDLRLNEFLVINTHDFQDDFGQQNAWFEIFNSGYGTVDMGGCYLSNDPENLKKYRIPRGDILTALKPRQHILFWADDQAYRGTFHVNFKLDDSEYLILTANDGRTILDQVRIPKNLNANQSYGRIVDGIGSCGPESNDEGWSVMERTSPSTNNYSLDGLTKSDRMKHTDPYGWIMAIMAMSVVFSALVLLYLAFKGIGKISIRLLQKKSDTHLQSTKVSVADTSGETYAAIATALFLYANESEIHDVENTILTINKIRRDYSPWSAKYQMFRQAPNVRKR